MLLFNHTVTGALIGLTLPPVVAAPVAFASHFALDSLPHTGFKGMSLKRGWGMIFGFVDCCVSLAVFLFIVNEMPQHFWIISSGVFFATLPDLFYIPDILWNKRYDPKFMRSFHHRIQWAESPQGMIADAVWFLSMLFFVFYH